MRFFILRLAIAILAFIIGLSAVALIGGFRFSPRARTPCRPQSFSQQLPVHTYHDMRINLTDEQIPMAVDAAPDHLRRRVAERNFNY